MFDVDFPLAWHWRQLPLTWWIWRPPTTPRRCPEGNERTKYIQCCNGLFLRIREWSGVQTNPCRKQWKSVCASFGKKLSNSQSFESDVLGNSRSSTQDPQQNAQKVSRSDPEEGRLRPNFNLLHGRSFSLFCSLSGLLFTAAVNARFSRGDLLCNLTQTHNEKKYSDRCSFLALEHTLLG